MYKKIPDDAKMKILNSLVYQEFKFWQDTDQLNREVVEGAVITMKYGIVTIKTLLLFHRAVLIKEIIGRGPQKNIKSILGTLYEIRDNKHVVEYLEYIPGMIERYKIEIAKFKKQVVLQDPAETRKQENDLKELIKKFFASNDIKEFLEH